MELQLRHVLPHTNSPAANTADGALLGQGRVERRKMERSGELTEGYRRRRGEGSGGDDGNTTRPLTFFTS